MTLPPIISFWHGPLSWLEVLCITAFVRHGHPVQVYSYDAIENLPPGAEWRDATALLPREKLVFYKGKGTPGVFSDHFRYAVMRAGLGVYADLDIYCVRPIAGPPDYLFAWERPGSVNGAVLRICHPCGVWKWPSAAWSGTGCRPSTCNMAPPARWR